MVSVYAVVCFKDICVDWIICMLEPLPCFQCSCVYAGVQWLCVVSHIENVRGSDIRVCFQPSAKLCSGLPAKVFMFVMDEARFMLCFDLLECVMS